jgi:hypothetical protein
MNESKRGSLIGGIIKKFFPGFGIWEGTISKYNSSRNKPYLGVFDDGTQEWYTYEELIKYNLYFNVETETDKHTHKRRYTTSTSTSSSSRSSSSSSSSSSSNSNSNSNSTTSTFTAKRKRAPPLPLATKTETSKKSRSSSNGDVQLKEWQHFGRTRKRRFAKFLKVNKGRNPSNNRLSHVIGEKLKNKSLEEVNNILAAFYLFESPLSSNTMNSTSRSQRRKITSSSSIISKRPRGELILRCTKYHCLNAFSKLLPIKCIYKHGFAMLPMNEEEKIILKNAENVIDRVTDKKWNNISLNSLSGSNKKVTQMLKACDIRKLSYMKDLELIASNVLMSGYQRIFGFSVRRKPLVVPTIVKIQWLRSFNMKVGSNRSSSSSNSNRSSSRSSNHSSRSSGTETTEDVGAICSNAQDLHRDYEIQLGNGLLAHSCIFTLKEKSHIILLPGSHKMTEAEIDESDEDAFCILNIPPYTMLFFDGQLAHAGPLFHVPTMNNKQPHHFRGFAYLVTDGTDLPDSGGKKRWFERVFLAK